MPAMPTREPWADQMDDSDQEMSVDNTGSAPKSGALRRNRSTDSNATHMSWDDSNTAELLQHLEKQSDMPQVHQSLSMPQGVPAQCAPLPLPGQWGPVFLMPALAQMPHAPCMAQGQAPTCMPQCQGPAPCLPQEQAPAAAPYDAGLQDEKGPVARRSSGIFEPPQVQRQPRLGRRRSSRHGLGPFTETALIKPMRKRRSSTMKDFKDPFAKRSRDDFGEIVAQQNTENKAPSNTTISQPEEASEEVWQHRIQKRRSAVSMIKATPEYQGCLAKQALRRPTTPDPDDRSVSKRAWEGKVVIWRTGLREGC